MKRRKILQGVVATSLATAMVILSWPAAAGSMGRQVMQGAHRSLEEKELKEVREEDQKEVKEQTREEVKEESKEEGQ